MVEVSRYSSVVVQRKAGKFLPQLIRYWQELPEVAAEIDSWDDGEALVYIEEWRFYESKRYDLERFAEMNLLSSSQRQQLYQLRELVAEHKPILDRLLGT